MGRPPTPKMERKPDVEFTPARKVKYLAHVTAHGTIYAGCAAVGITAQTLTNHREKDPEFKQLEIMAREQHTDMLVAEATRRAVVGYEKPLIGGKNKDRVVAKERCFSDGLMQTLLRAKRGEYGNEGSSAGEGGGGGGGGGGVLVVPQAPHSIAEWQSLYGEKAKGLTHAPKDGVA